VGDLKGDIFSVLPGSHYVDHTTIRSLWLAKTGDKFFWKEKFHAANGKAQAHTECALHFFLLNLVGGDLEGDIFQFSLVQFSHPTIRSLWVGPSREKRGEGGGTSSQS